MIEMGMSFVQYKIYFVFESDANQTRTSQLSEIITLMQLATEILSFSTFIAHFLKLACLKQSFASLEKTSF